MKNLIAIIFSLALLLSFTACKKKTDPEPQSVVFPLNTPDQVTQDEYDIYSAVLKQNSIPGLFVIRQKTKLLSWNQPSSSPFVDTLRKEFPDLDSALIYGKRNETMTNYLDKKIKAGSRQVTLIAEAEINYFFSGSEYKKNWDNYIKKHKVGYITFSRISLNEARNQAIVSFDMVTGPMDYEGTTVYVRKDAHGRKVVKLLSLVMS